MAIVGETATATDCRHQTEWPMRQCGPNRNCASGPRLCN